MYKSGTRICLDMLTIFHHQDVSYCLHFWHDNISLFQCQVIQEQLSCLFTSLTSILGSGLACVHDIVLQSHCASCQSMLWGFSFGLQLWQITDHTHVRVQFYIRYNPAPIGLPRKWTEMILTNDASPRRFGGGKLDHPESFKTFCC